MRAKGSAHEWSDLSLVVVGRSLSERIAQWPRPPKPKMMGAEEYARYPEFITLREVEANDRILVASMLDPKTAPIGELGTLYKMRWNIEVDFRTIRATLAMDVLRCKRRRARVGGGDRILPGAPALQKMPPSGGIFIGRIVVLPTEIR